MYMSTHASGCTLLPEASWQQIARQHINWWENLSSGVLLVQKARAVNRPLSSHRTRTVGWDDIYDMNWEMNTRRPNSSSRRGLPSRTSANIEARCANRALPYLMHQ